jgi:hypothetical protein
MTLDLRENKGKSAKGMHVTSGQGNCSHHTIEITSKAGAESGQEDTHHIKSCNLANGQWQPEMIVS